jgi:hypothetical protein
MSCRSMYVCGFPRQSVWSVMFEYVCGFPRQSVWSIMFEYVCAFPRQSVGSVMFEAGIWEAVYLPAVHNSTQTTEAVEYISQ